MGKFIKNLWVINLNNYLENAYALFFIIEDEIVK
ncbi:hypothetical protein BANRA_04431 [Escherichia coli]|nr:hypothetical protein BANRA_04431 [Escherichia coli]